MSRELPDGLYDLLLSQTLSEALAEQTSKRDRTLVPVEAEDAPEQQLTAQLASQVASILDDLGGSGEKKIRRQLDLINTILLAIRQQIGSSATPPDLLATPLQRLQAIHRGTPPPSRRSGARPDAGRSAASRA